MKKSALISIGFIAAAALTLSGKALVEAYLPAFNFNEFDVLFKKAGAKYGVDWTWLKAIALNESNLGNYSSVRRGIEYPDDILNSISDDGKSWGLMQVTLETAISELDRAATPQKLNNPEYSIDLAAKYISIRKKEFPVSEDRYLEWVIKSYNQGSGNTKKERLKQISGYANDYWVRFQRNLEKVQAA